MQKVQKVLFTILLILEIIIAVAAAVIGLLNIKVSFIDDTRMAVIILGVIGMIFCIPGIICFVKRAPVKALTLLGYLLGAIALFTFFIQLFKIDMPFFGNPQLALVTLAVIIILKGVIGCHFPAKKAQPKADDTDFPERR